MKLKIISPLVSALLWISLNPVLTVKAGGDVRAEAETALKNLRSADSTLTNLFCHSAGFAVFPKVGKAGVILGAERGNGVVYQLSFKPLNSSP